MRSVVLLLCLAGCHQPAEQVVDLVGTLVQVAAQPKCWVVRAGEPEGWDDDPFEGVSAMVIRQVGTDTPICQVVVDPDPVPGDDIVILEMHLVAQKDVHDILLAWGVPDE